MCLIGQEISGCRNAEIGLMGVTKREKDFVGNQSGIVIEKKPQRKPESKENKENCKIGGGNVN